MRLPTDAHSEAFSKCVRCNRLTIGDGNWIDEPCEFMYTARIHYKNTICTECSRARFPQFYADVQTKTAQFNLR